MKLDPFKQLVLQLVWRVSKTVFRCLTQYVFFMSSPLGSLKRSHLFCCTNSFQTSPQTSLQSSLQPTPTTTRSSSCSCSEVSPYLSRTPCAATAWSACPTRTWTASGTRALDSTSTRPSPAPLSSPSPARTLSSRLFSSAGS